MYTQSSLVKVLVVNWFWLNAISVMAAHPAEGRFITSGPGPEDLTAITWGGKPALITGTVTRLLSFTPQAGRLEVYEPGKGTTFTPVACKYPEGFTPVGLHVVASSTLPGFVGKQLLYVANAKPEGAKKSGSVEVFEITDKHISYLATLGPSPLLQGPNGITVTRDGTVYVTTFALFPSKNAVVKIVEPGQPEANKGAKNTIICFKPTGKGSRYSGEWRVVATGVNGANGLALTGDDKVLLCNAYHSHCVYAFHRRPTDGGFSSLPTAVLEGLKFGPDNLKALAGDEFSTAGQKSFWCTAGHFITQGCWPAHGGAVSFKLKGGGAEITADWTEIMSRDGRCPSTVLPFHGKAYVSHIVRSGIFEIPVK